MRRPFVALPLEKNKVLRILDGKRSEHDGIDEAEDGGVSADAESESEHGDGGEAGGSAQHAQGVAQVLNQRFKEMRALGFAAFFLELLVAAELEPGASPGVCMRNPGTLEVIGAILDVRTQFLFHLLVNPRPMKERRNDRTERGEDPHISSGWALSAEAIAATRRFQPSSSWRKRFRPAVVSS